MAIRILIVDDHPYLRTGLRALLQLQKEFEIVAEAKDGQEAVDVAMKKKPDVVIMDISMPKLNGIEATRKICSQAPEIKILALSIHSGKQFVKNMLDAGAKGYMLKDSVPDELIEAINTVVNGEIYLPPDIARIVLKKEEQKEKTTNVLKTKLHRPRITVEHVYREHLINFLEQNRYKPFTLVSAPAGYGKSMLISSWLDKGNCPYTWISLSADENDLRSFLEYIDFGIKKIFPNALENITALINGAELPPTSVIEENLINDLDDLDQEFVLVLDDYHLIRNQQINEIVDLLLKYPPQNMHLVLLTRRDPALNLSALRAHSRMNELRMNDLRFNKNEIEILFNQKLAFDLNEDTIERLYKKTEGWISGIRLASLAIKDPKDANRILNNIKGDVHLLAEFLTKEILLNQPIQIQKNLLRTCLLNRFSTSLLNEFILKNDEESALSGQEFIDWLLKYNLFIIPLDETNEWFRFHHLFQELLQKELVKKQTPNEILNHHKQAGIWFEKNHFIEEALEHFLSAEEIDSAVSLIEDHRYELMNTAQWNHLDQMLKKLPPEIVDQNPVLVMTKVYIYECQGKFKEINSCLANVKDLLSSPHQKPEILRMLQGEVAVIEGEINMISGEGQITIDKAEQAIGLLPENAYHIWSYAIGEKVLGYQMIGNINKGFTISNKLLNGRKLPSGLQEARMALWYCTAYSMEGDIVKLKQPALQCIKLGEKYGLIESVFFGKYFMGLSLYLRNELAEAEAFLCSMMDDAFLVRPIYLVQGAILLAIIYTEQGYDEKASNIIDAVISDTINTNDTIARLTAVAFQAELMLKQGRKEKAISINKQLVYELLPPLWFYYVPQLTPIKILLTENSPESLLEAINLLDQLEIYLRKANRKNTLIRSLALKALIYNAQGKEEQALEKLTESLEMAKPSGMIGNYLDMGEQMITLIKKIPSQQLAKFTAQIIRAFDKGNRLQHQKNPSPPSTSLVSNDIDPLTFRELDVIKSVALGLRNKEVADQLFVSPATIKKHLKNIFLKLDVHNRVHAVRKAAELNII